MNLKTHTVYPDGNFDEESGEWGLRLIAGDGEVKETASGKAKNRSAARVAIAAATAKLEGEYLIPTDEE